MGIKKKCPQLSPSLSGLFSGIAHFKLDINGWNIPFPKILRMYQTNFENIFHWEKWNEPIENSSHTRYCFEKMLWGYIFLANLYNSIALMIELKRLSVNNIFSLFVFAIIFRFLRTFLITLILDEKYLCCSMKVQNNSPHIYIAYSLDLYYLSFIKPEI